MEATQAAAYLQSLPNTDQPPRTRCGYAPSEVIQAFHKSMLQTGTFATGRCIHFAADLVCSGGFESFLRLLWDYALTHVGIASPRIFVYLKRRCDELRAILKGLPDENAYRREDFQVRVGELILVTRDAPTRAAAPWPKVGPETHQEGWVLGAITDVITPAAATVKVFKPDADLNILRTAGTQICRAIGEGSTERALFWLKWLLEEESIYKKRFKGRSLSVVERGPAIVSPKQRTDAVYFVLEMYTEIYKELVAKQAIRMDEEFQCLLDLWSDTPKGVSGAARKQILTLLTQILCEVPRWKVPAAAPLIKDPVFLSQAVKQVPKLFAEVLAYELAPTAYKLVKQFKGKGTSGSASGSAKPITKGGQVKGAAQTTAMDKALEEYFKAFQ